MSIEEHLKAIQAQVEEGFKTQSEAQMLIKALVSEPMVLKDPVDTAFDRLIERMFGI